MFKRLLLVGLLAVMLVSPGFADIPKCNGKDCIVNCSDDNCVPKETQQCTYSTLSSYGGDAGSVLLKAVWAPHEYSCGAGFYLKVTADSVSCEQCLENNYCPRFVNVPFDVMGGADYGLNSCPETFPESVAGAKTQADCYKTASVSCSVAHPYTFGNGTAVYYNDTVSCRKYAGDNSGCKLVNADSCDFEKLICDSGFIQEEVDGELRCLTANVSCLAGTYLPKGERTCSECPEDSYCAGSGDTAFTVSATQDQGIMTCDAGLKSPRGSYSVDDCGYIVHFGNNPDDKLYLHATQRTHPSLAVDIKGQTWFADMTPMDEGAKNMYETTTKTLHVVVDGTEYTVHTTIFE